MLVTTNLLWASNVVNICIDTEHICRFCVMGSTPWRIKYERIPRVNKNKKKIKAAKEKTKGNNYKKRMAEIIVEMIIRSYLPSRM